MARRRIGNYGALSVVLQPHPPGAYYDLFKEAARSRRAVYLRSDRRARLGPITKVKDGIFSGVVAFWTEIDGQSKGINISDLQQNALSQLGVSLPPGIGFNSRVFAYSFNEKKHRMVVQLKNDEGETVSIQSVKKAIENILGDALPPGFESVDVHIETDKDALEKVLRLPNISRIRIVVYRPNPDSLEERVERKRRELERANIAREETIATKRKGADTINVVGDLRDTAELARTDGFVEVDAKIEGKKSTHSTEEFPKVIKVPLNNDETSAVVTKRLAAE